MSRDISAIDGGDVFRIERMEIARVIPVVQVAAELFRACRWCQMWPRSAPGHLAFPASRRSRAASVERRYSPMFVGEVRWATTGLGSSWKLSGGRKCSSAVTNVSKKRQVRREASRRDRTFAADSSGSVPLCRGGRLIQCATAGAHTHTTTKGRAAKTARGCTNHTAAKAAIANRTPPIMRRKTCARFRSTRYLACAAVTHSSMCLCVKSDRTRVRPIASAISQA